MDHILNIVGGGLAGCEAAYYAASKGIKVNLYEMRHGENNLTPAHNTDGLAELVCSNSFRNSSINSAIGLLHQELRILKSLIIEAADNTKVPAGGALAMDRELFSEYITKKITSHPNINIIRKEITHIDEAKSNEKWIIATGPLTSDKLSNFIQDITSSESLAFFDAIAPIVYKDSIDMNIAWFQSRYDKIGPEGDGKDYINLPLTMEEYHNFINELINADVISFKEWEKDTPYFNACLPIEVMASRGVETLRFGPMKPVGLTNPHQPDIKPYAIVQLRQDNKLGSLYNMVGFQTKMKYGEQKRIFSSLPGMKNAEFARLGGLHRNSFINSPKLLNNNLSLKNRDDIYFAGQITGVEGYVESSAIGLMASIFACNELLNKEQVPAPYTSSIGSLLRHITEMANIDDFQPMNVNFGLFEPLDPELYFKDNGKKKKLKKAEKAELYAKRAIDDITSYAKDI